MPPRAVVERESTDDRFANDALVGKALSFIHFKKGLNIRAADVAAEVGLSNNWLETRFRQSLGTSITDEIGKIRLQTVLQLIRETEIPFNEIARRCGFTNPSTLCRLVKQATGQTMTALRANTSAPRSVPAP